MTARYLEVRLVTAWPRKSTGGESVYVDDGLTVGEVPREDFEETYFKVHDADDTRIHPDTVDRFIKSIEFTGRSGNHAVFLVTLANGFTLVESSACVTADNFDESKAREIVVERVRKQVYTLLGFLLKWAREGLTT